MKMSVHKVSRSQPDGGKVQTQRGGFISETMDAQAYGLQRVLPEESMAIVLQPDAENGRYAVLGYTEALPYGLETGEVALYSEHGQVLFLKDDGSVHLEAAGKVSIHSDQEDLYSLLKELLSVIKGLTTAKIDTTVTGTLDGSSVKGSGSNLGVGLAASSTQKLDQVARRLDKLLQKGEMPQSAEKQERKREEAQQKTAALNQSSQNNKQPQTKAVGAFELKLR
ncbi:MAG: hypothetical protein AAF975_02430 [Spirochaetota bacterium]